MSERMRARTDLRSARVVRLSQLRKLRECEQVAALCYRVRGGEIEFLLVQTRGSGRWTFPKGGAEPGLTHAQAAAIEAFEEAGVHGRIEEAAFTRYVRRQRSGAPNSGKGKTAEREIAVTAHLCEVLRLGPPQEAKRERTWFSIEEARERLRHGRRRDDGVVFARVIDRAVARIEKSKAADRFADDRQENRLQISQGGAAQKDPLQKVQFEFAEAYDRPRRRSAVKIVDMRRNEVLPCEVLEFGSAKRFSRRQLKG